MITRRIYYGWWIVAAFAVLNVYWYGTLVVGLTVFFRPIQRSFGWQAGSLAFVFSTTNIATSLLAPLVGTIFDRAGPRLLMLFAAASSGGGLILLSQSRSEPLFVAAFALVAVGFGVWAAGTGPAAAGLWFIRRRGLAMGIILGASSIGAAMVPIWNVLIGALGWRSTVLIAGLLLWLVSIPVSLVLRHRPADLGLAPDGDLPGDEMAPAAGLPRVSLPSVGVGVGRALATWQFWLIALTSMALGAGSAAATLLMLPRLQDAHVRGDLAIATVTAVTFVGALSRLGSGALADRTGAVFLSALSGVLQAAGLLAFAVMPDSLAGLLVFIAGFGLGSENARLLSALLFTRWYGPHSFGRIQGFLYVFLLPGRVAGPVVAGRLHDAGHGYAAAFIAFAMLSLLVVVPLLLLRPPRFSPEPERPPLDSSPVDASDLR